MIEGLKKVNKNEIYNKMTSKKNLSKFQERFSAHEKIRTSTPEGTTPSRWRVYQFHHVRRWEVQK
tara:strand:+ start:29543 stop:29737 length:195 start_codon:yes stop_codon:yes gene_type:complete